MIIIIIIIYEEEKDEKQVKEIHSRSTAGRTPRESVLKQAPRDSGGIELHHRLSLLQSPPPPPPQLTLPKFTVDETLSAFRTISIPPSPFLPYWWCSKEAKNSTPERMQPLHNWKCCLYQQGGGM